MTTEQQEATVKPSRIRSDEAALAKRVAWRPEEWRTMLPMSRSRLEELLGDGTIPSTLVFGSRFITESPQSFLARVGSTVKRRPCARNRNRDKQQAAPPAA